MSNLRRLAQTRRQPCHAVLPRAGAEPAGQLPLPAQTKPEKAAFAQPTPHGGSGASGPPDPPDGAADVLEGREPAAAQTLRVPREHESTTSSKARSFLRE